MKYLAYSLAVVLSFIAGARALPLQPGVAPGDAKWLVHLDLDNFRESKLGSTVINEMLAAPLAKLKTEFKVDGELILKKLHSLTAFGTDFEAGSQADGVLLLSGDEETQKIAEGFLAVQILQNTNGP